ncbi:MAG: hypothetical protein HC933_00780 [Pleurocapsa sp. SU_196_0]|nr:hypothetical protein [Pleurocapsa sp. SU_196_0]
MPSRATRRAFRSKGGKVVIDEYAFHENADELWKAAAPSILWGFPMRVFSSHNGKNSRFYRLVLEAQQPGSRWSRHKVTIFDAIQDGLVSRIKGLDHEAMPEEIQEFLDECHAIAGDEETFEQEFGCNPQDDKSAFVPHALIYANEDATIPDPIRIHGAEVNLIDWEQYAPELPLELYRDARYYLGVDIGRKHDLTVMWLLEDVAGLLVTRLVWELHAVKFRHQYAHLKLLLPFVARACLDETGIGAQLAEDAVDDFGSWRVEPVTFSGPVKEELAFGLKRALEDRAVRNPATETIRKDFAKIKKVMTAAGHVRFEGERDADGHADRWWALALANHAKGKGVRGPPEYKTVTAGRFSDWKGVI